MTVNRSVRLYLRQSLVRSEESVSLDLQERVLRHWAKDLDRPVAGVRREPNVKGWAKARPEFEAAVAECIAHGDDLMVYDLTRFARRLRYQEETFDKLAEHGLTVLSKGDPWSSDPLVRQLFGAIAESQTRTLSRWIRDAARERARRGIHHGSLPPTGYVRTGPSAPLAPHPDPVIAEIPERVFRLYAVDGLGINAIAERLTIDGVPTGRGAARWSPTAVANMLKNRTYIGDVVTADVHTEGAHPPLVPRELWDAAERKRNEPRTRQHRHTDDSWLVGVAYCGCGRRAYWWKSGKDPRRPNTWPRPRLVCSTHFGAHRDARDCGQRPKSIQVNRLETLAAAALVDALTRVPQWERAYREAVAAYRASEPGTDRQRASFERRIGEIERERASLLRKSNKGLIDDERWADEDRRLATAVDTLRASIARLAVPPDPEPYQLAADVAVRLADDIADVAAFDRDALRGVVNLLGARVTIQPPHLILPDPLARVLGLRDEKRLPG